jgi:choline dehydrogenase-like flavoprotein
MNEKVDVLIIGSGASGAAVAWSLAETKMRILCLEQGDWMKQSDYPSNGRDWEARLYDDFATSPNRRARPTDYPINDDNSPIKVVNFNGVGGSTIMYTGHYPRLHPSDFRVRCHDVKNMFIVDGSIFVTSGGVNPTSTIQALALYIADGMKQRLATLFD